MATKTIYFTNDPGSRVAVPVYVVPSPHEPGAVIAREVKTTHGADLIAYRVENRQAARAIAYLSPHAV
jgi:hypothetical protein